MPALKSRTIVASYEAADKTRTETELIPHRVKIVNEDYQEDIVKYILKMALSKTVYI